MSNRDPLRPYMDIIDVTLTNMVSFLFMFVAQIFNIFHFLILNLQDKMILISYIQLNEDPSFKPQGGRLGENDMDYDADEKSMATLRRQLGRAKAEYYRCKR